MDRIYQTQTANDFSNLQLMNGKVYSGEIQKSLGHDKTTGGSFINDEKKPLQQLNPSSKVGLHQKSGNKLVPLEQRLSTLANVFDDKTLKRLGAVECTTCATRTYQDQSDDASVSFQAPTQLSPSQAASAVVSHEMEHVSNEQADAKQEGKEVIAQTVQIFHSICPECGISYVSGGLTKTTTLGKTNPYKNVMTHQATGNLVDMML
ncbi:MAG: hypothetical protein CVV00_03285 [Firmicutes bacterium HGW-Firmicutes-5]|nr:MAG: hypothetical protein CVV00_03285 [Firmicutes bacterium HGW-Firmicutes-5]